MCICQCTAAAAFRFLFVFFVFFFFFVFSCFLLSVFCCFCFLVFFCFFFFFFRVTCVAAATRFKPTLFCLYENGKSAKVKALTAQQHKEKRKKKKETMEKFRNFFDKTEKLRRCIESAIPPPPQLFESFPKIFVNVFLFFFLPFLLLLCIFMAA